MLPACHLIGCHISSFPSATAGFWDDFFFCRGTEGAIISATGCRGPLDRVNNSSFFHSTNIDKISTYLSQTWTGGGANDNSAPTHRLACFSSAHNNIPIESRFTPAATCLSFSDTVFRWNALLSSPVKIFQNTTTFQTQWVSWDIWWGPCTAGLISFHPWDSCWCLIWLKLDRGPHSWSEKREIVPEEKKSWLSFTFWSSC